MRNCLRNKNKKPSCDGFLFFLRDALHKIAFGKQKRKGGKDMLQHFNIIAHLRVGTRRFFRDIKRREKHGDPNADHPQNKQARCLFGKDGMAFFASFLIFSHNHSNIHIVC